MAPGLPEVATKYRIANQTTLALTLSIFLLSFAVGVSATHLHVLTFSDFPQATMSRATFRDVWTDVGKAFSSILAYCLRSSIGAAY
jgi:hypothetical protein